MPSYFTISMSTPASSYFFRKAADAIHRHRRAPLSHRFRLGLLTVRGRRPEKILHRLRTHLDGVDVQLQDAIEQFVGVHVAAAEVVRHVQADLHAGELRVRFRRALRPRGRRRKQPRPWHRRHRKPSKVAPRQFHIALLFQLSRLAPARRATTARSIVRVRVRRCNFTVRAFTSTFYFLLSTFDASV